MFIINKQQYFVLIMNNVLIFIAINKCNYSTDKMYEIKMKIYSDYLVIFLMYVRYLKALRRRALFSGRLVWVQFPGSADHRFVQTR